MPWNHQSALQLFVMGSLVGNDDDMNGVVVAVGFFQFNLDVLGLGFIQAAHKCRGSAVFTAVAVASLSVLCQQFRDLSVSIQVVDWSWRSE